VYLWGIMKVGEGPIMPSRRTIWIGVDILKFEGLKGGIWKKVRKSRKMRIYMRLLCHYRIKLGKLTI
jgi:hypothetical protein